MIDRIIRGLGVDPIQWRALVTVYLRMDFRAGGGATRREGSGKARGHPLFGIAIVTGMGGAMFAMLAARLPDILVSATLLTTYGAINTVMVLLVDFTGIVVSPDDYAVLGHRPVSSRTYFASRLTAILAYIAIVSTVLAVLPSICYAFWWRLGLAGAAMTFAAVILCNTSATVLIITTYVVTMTIVHPHRLRRALSYLQLVSMMAFYYAYYLAMQGFRDSFLFHLSFGDRPWMWANPAAWFAAFVRLTSADPPRAAWVAAGAAVAVTIACVPLAAGRLSLEYAQRLAETTAAGEPARSGRRVRLPGFRRGESRAIAVLVAAQFRFDQKFRMAILGIVPLILFYLLLGLNQGALVDPFVPGTESAAGAPLYMAVVFMPMTLHASLQYSDSWRAAWIFFATPASAARLIVAAKNFVAVWFLGGYLILLAGIWSYYYERVWHAFFHAAMIGLLAHMLLQLAVMLRPALPFAAESRKIERSSGLYAVLFLGSIIAGIIPVFLPSVYARPPLTAVVVALMLAATAALEYTLRLRVAEAIGDLEFRA
jgi:ABC-2 type transport system permease protein